LKTRTLLSWGGAFAFVLFLAGAAAAQGTAQDNPGVWLPFSASSYADEIDFLYRVIFWVTTVMFFLTEGLLLLFCVIYRRRPGHRPTYTHGNSTAEITWTVIPAVMLLGLAIWQIPTWNKIKKHFPGKNDPNVLEIDVLGEQYKWNVRYPGTKDKYKGEFEYTNLSNIHMPFGHTALCNIRSKDVIHSLFIPHMRVKQDTVPGLRQKVWFKPNRFFLKRLKNDDGSAVALEQKGEFFKRDKLTDEWLKEPRMVQPTVFIYLDDDASADLPKDCLRARDFLPGGRLFDKRIAVQEHREVDGLYKVDEINGVFKKVKVLYQGKVSEGQQFASCDYALGIFEIACAELCGMAHYTMRAFLYVEPPAVYETWIKSEAEDAGKLPPAWNFWRN
jgi:heme/copper-type cytochrome/quinol oxidase subunit 2